jgi:hypothetical protein
MNDGIKGFAYITWFEFDLDAALPAIHEYGSLAARISSPANERY